MDARCGLPELGTLMEQYGNVLELVKDGNDPGYALDEQGQGTPHFMERFAAALEYENCRDLIMPDIFTLSCYYKDFTSILGLV